MAVSHKNCIAIIGGGASGIFCATLLSALKIPILLFEKNKTLGKKLLATGNGRCNIHNTNTNAKAFQSSSFSQKELDLILQNFNHNAFINFCKKIGLLLNVTENGKIYPLSNSAKSVLHLFLQYAQKNENLRILNEKEIINVKKSNNSFLVECKNKLEVESYLCSHLILACGSKAAPKLGGSDAGLMLAKALNLEIIESYPSLCPILCKFKSQEFLNGVKIKAKLSLKQNSNILAQILDDVLFTKDGISGFCALDISAFIKDKENLEILIDFLPNFTQNELEQLFLKLAKNNNYYLEYLLCGFLHPKIATYFAKNYEFNLQNTKHCKQLSFLLKNFPCKSVQSQGFLNAEVSGGGVSGNAINKQNFSVKNAKNLYVIGEMLDVVGNRGGFNLAFAWASAWHCAQAIKKELEH